MSEATLELQDKSKTIDARQITSRLILRQNCFIFKETGIIGRFIFMNAYFSFALNSRILFSPIRVNSNFTKMVFFNFLSKK